MSNASAAISPRFCLGIAVPGTLFAAALGGAAGLRAAMFVRAAIQLTGAVVSPISVRRAA